MEYVIRDLSITDTQYLELEGISSKKKDFNSFYNDYISEKKYFIRVIIVKGCIVTSGSLILFSDLNKSIITDLFGNKKYYGIIISDLKLLSCIKGVTRISVIERMKSGSNKYIRNYVNF
jgi:hypothetical protein